MWWGKFYARGPETPFVFGCCLGVLRCVVAVQDGNRVDPAVSASFSRDAQMALL